MMDKVKHTPGPWLVTYEFGTKVVKAADQTTIMGNETYYPYVPENDADWYLIAAAPDLLEACKDFVTKCDRGEARSTKSYTQMKTAITKAEGL